MRGLAAVLVFFGLASAAQGFCGLYVARADGELFNEASKVVMVRDGRRTTITMSSDYRGPASDFAMIVPAPRILRRNQIATVKAATVAHLDAYSAPRLVEYGDIDPCVEYIVEPSIVVEEAAPGAGSAPRRGADALGVTVEARYAVGVYDIAILSAELSDGLVIYLRQEGYRIPDGADLVLADYIADGMKFFVARVNLQRHDRATSQDLPPLRISFRSDKFLLPLQLGKINADQEQQVLLLTLTRRDRVEAANYRNTEIPTDIDVPVFVEDVFGQFYRRVFATTAKRDTVVTEYAWDMAWCDPCAADPLSTAELRELGVTWARGNSAGGQDVFVTRMHFRYDARGFQRDLLLRETDDRSNFQGRYVMHIPYPGKITCEAGVQYVRDTRQRLRSEAKVLRRLTGWSRAEIDARIRQSVPAVYQY